MGAGHEAFSTDPEDLPVFGTIASRLNDNGVTALYQQLCEALSVHGLRAASRSLPYVTGKVSDGSTVMVPHGRNRYLAETADTVRAHHLRTTDQVAALRRADAVAETTKFATERGIDMAGLDLLNREAQAGVDPDTLSLVESWPETVREYSGDEISVKSNGAVQVRALAQVSSSGTRVPRVALPRFADRGELLRWLRSENLPGRFPFTAGFSRSNARRNTRPGCSPGKGTRSGPTGGSICWRTTSPPPGFRRPSTP